MTIVTCDNCSESFDVKPYRLRRNKSGRIYCSTACRQADGSTYTGTPRELPDLTCPVCGTSFYRKRAERLAVNYCSYACAARGTRNLKPTPKGVRRSTATEFRPGQRPANVLPVGAVTVRKRPRRHDVRAWVKVAEPNVWRPRALVVWEEANGRALRRGEVVHHVNGDSLDDRPENLEALSRSEHIRRHADDLRVP